MYLFENFRNYRVLFFFLPKLRLGEDDDELEEEKEEEEEVLGEFLLRFKVSKSAFPNLGETKPLIN